MQADGGQPRPGEQRAVGAGETVLRGGTSNSGLVVRVQDTVRRPQTAASPAVHALLRHLERRGFDGAPRYLGEDGEGREVLSYLEGDVPTTPLPGWAMTDEALASVTDLLRRYHRAVEGFDPAGHVWGSQVPPPYRGALVGHNDPSPDNIVFRDGRAVALIDFDLASPGSTLWDLALLVRLWVPLRDPVDVPDHRSGRMGERLRLAADAYGLPAAERERLLRAARHTHGWCYDIVRAGAERGQAGYARYWTPAEQERDQRGRRWFATAADALAGELRQEP
jgi:Ser/Thr protein kinase RdoA (MazF antagonist)